MRSLDFSYSALSSACSNIVVYMKQCCEIFVWVSVELVRIRLIIERDTTRCSSSMYICICIVKVLMNGVVGNRFLKSSKQQLPLYSTINRRRVVRVTITTIKFSLYKYDSRFTRFWRWWCMYAWGYCFDNDNILNFYNMLIVIFSISN